MELKNRRDMDPNFMWEFAHIFPTREAWEEAFAQAEAFAKDVAKFAGTLGESACALQAAFDYYYAGMEKLELVYLYAMLHKNADNSDPAYQKMEARAMSLVVGAESAASYLMPELLAIPEETLAAFMKEPGLARYHHIMEDATRGRAHTLDAQRELMLARLGEAAQTPDNAYTMLSSVDMTFPEIVDEKGEKAPLTHANFGVFRESSDRRARKEAFETYFGEYGKYINTFAALYSGSVKFDCYNAQTRNYASACEAALFRSNVPPRVLESLFEAIHARLSTMQQYLAVRKDALNVEQIHMYDLYCPLLPDVDFNLTYEQSKALVKEALAPLGAEYAKLLDQAYDNKWMDVYENRGKTTGAFSCGVYGVHPYVLLNYTGKLDDAFTMAHELGHAMHSYQSSQAQDYANNDYHILVAEVASTVNEVLLCKHLLATETDKARRAYVLNHFLEGFRTTVFRQTLFAEFEKKAHEMYEAGEPLTAEALNELYRSLNELYYEGAVMDDFQRLEWARIPHFYHAFYVYQYATGFCSAVAIASAILESGDATNYLKFLSTGGSDYPLEELKIAGVDLTEPDAVLRALDVFAQTLDEFEALRKEI